MSLDFCRSAVYLPGEQLAVAVSYRRTGEALQLHARCYRAFDKGLGDFVGYCRAIIVRIIESVKGIFGCSAWQLGVRGFAERLRYYRREMSLSDEQISKLADQVLNIALELHLAHTVDAEKMALVTSSLQSCFSADRHLPVANFIENPTLLIDPRLLCEQVTGRAIRHAARHSEFVLPPEARGRRPAPNLHDLSPDLVAFLEDETPTVQILMTYWNTMLPASSQIDVALMARLRLSSREEESLLSYMMGLTKTQDFTVCVGRRNFAIGLQNILQLAGKDEAFREYFFEQIEEALTHCCDRVAAYHALLVGAAKVATASTAVEKAVVVIGLHRIHLIQELAAAKGGSETIQCFVRYLMGLKAFFRLPIDLHDSKYGSLVTEADLAAARRTLEEATSTPDKILYILVQDAHWQKWLEGENREVFAQILGVHAEMLEGVESEAEGDYLKAVQAIEKQRQGAIEEAYMDLTTQWLISAREELYAAL